MLEAAEAVAASIDASIRQESGQFSDAASVLDGVASLLESSLLRQESGAGEDYRYRMLETVREYGPEPLAQAGEAVLARNVHAEYFIGLKEWLTPNKCDPPGRFEDRLRNIETEYPNLWAALDWLKETGDAERVLHLAGSLAVFWHHRGYLREGRERLEWALTGREDAKTASRGWALAGLSLIVWTQGDPDAAIPLAKAALESAEEINVIELKALSKHILGIVESARGQLASAQ